MKIFRAVGLDSIFVCRHFQRLNWASLFSLLSRQCIRTNFNITTGIQYQGGVHCAVANIVEEFIAPLPISRKSPLHCNQYPGALIAPLPTMNNNILGFKSSLGYLQQLPNLFIASLPTAVCIVNKRPKRHVRRLAVRLRIAYSCTRWRRIFKGFSQDGRWADYSKTLRASLFNKGLWNKPNFSWNHASCWKVPLNLYKFHPVAKLSSIGG